MKPKTHKMVKKNVLKFIAFSNTVFLLFHSYFLAEIPQMNEEVKDKKTSKRRGFKTSKICVLS